MMTGRDFWIGTATAVAIGVMLAGLFFVLSVALITPPSANRALVVRIYLTAIWLLGGILSFGWVMQTGNADRMTAWTYPTFLIMMCALLVTISNSDQISQRVRRTIPQSRLKRVLAFAFFNGAAGGLVWVAMILATTFLLSRRILLAFPKSTVDSSAGYWFVTTTAYAFSYSLTALFIHRKFLSKHPPKLAGLFAVLLAGAWAIVPSIGLFFLNRLSWKSVEGLQLGNIFNVFAVRDENERHQHLLFAGVWLALMLALNAGWFLRQVKNFRPPPGAPPVLE
jgi:hypothetical protein